MTKRRAEDYAAMSCDIESGKYAVGGPLARKALAHHASDPFSGHENEYEGMKHSRAAVCRVRSVIGSSIEPKVVKRFSVIVEEREELVR